jgi:murein DD-endopeptidase MepM/ murein hydrolase activator NlpD
MKKLWLGLLCLVLTLGLLPVTPVGAAAVDGVWATGYYCVYNSEISGTQTVTKEISGTVYMLKASFLFGGHGVGMQGTGRTGPDGVYIHYDGGAGPGDLGLGDFTQITEEVQDRYAAIGVTDFTGFGNIALAYPASATYSVKEGVIGAYGTILTPWRSIAVDVSAPVLSGGTTGGLHFRSGVSSPDGAGCISFSVDDRGGGGEDWIDVYVGEGQQALDAWIATGGNRYVDLFVPSTSEQPQLKAPWRGSAKISQGNHGTYSHYDGGTWDNTYAIDVALSEGSDVLAPADGVVVYVDNDAAGAGGKEVAIEHTGPTGGKFTTVYCHLSDIIVEESDPVVQGQVVAKSGSTGTVTGPHLHFHMWSGTGSYDSHTMPIERLVMKQVGVDPGFREYDARVCDLEDIQVANKFFESNNSAHYVDVFMLVDLTGSFYDDLPKFKTQAPDLIATLQSSHTDIRFGLGIFRDYPISPFGGSSDKAYEQLVNLTTDDAAVLSIIAGLSAYGGADGPESQLVALYQAATGAGQDLSSFGYPGASIPPGQQANFRDGATKLFLLWTDATFHNPGDPGNIPYPGPSFDDTVDAILALDPPMVIGISSGGGGFADLQAIAAVTGAIAPSGGIDTDGDGIVDIPEGEPLVATIGYSGQGIAAAIESLVETAAVLPIADAGGAYMGEVGENIVLDGSGSFDPDGTIVLYEWDFESDGVFDFGSVEPTAEYAYPAEFSGVVTLRVTDDDGNIATDISPVEVLLPPNITPIADAGPDQTVCATAPAMTAMVTLDGSRSYDWNSDPLTYNWTWDDNTASGMSPTVELPIGTTTITLIVNDGSADSDPDTVDINVRIPAYIDFAPDVLNREAKGKYVTAYIELPTGYDVSQIDISSIRLNDIVPALGKPTGIGDHDNDGIPDLMVKFHRTMVQDVLTIGGEIEVAITGEVDGIGFEGSDTISRVITPAPPGLREWTRVSTPTTEDWVLAPNSVIVDYAMADDGDVAYAIVYSYDTSQFHLLKSTDGAATWEDITDAVEDVLDDNDYINYLPRVATDNVTPDFVAAALDMWDDSDGADEVHVFISTDGGATFEDAGEVEDGGVYFSVGSYVSDLVVSPEVDGACDIAIGGRDNYGDAALFRCTVTGDLPSAWEDATDITDYLGWDNMWPTDMNSSDDIYSLLVTDIIFSPNWAEDKTILVSTVNDSLIGLGYDVYLQSGSWGTSESWNEKSTLGIEAVPIIEDVDIPMWLADFDARRIAGITLPSDYNSRNADTRYAWVWVNYYDPDWGEPACQIMRVDDDSADPVGPMGQVEDGELWLTNVSYKGTIAEGEAIAGVLGSGTYDPDYGSTEDLLEECCEGVQVFRNDGVRNMDICCIRWHDACKPPTGTFATAVSYVGEDKAYAISLWGFFSPYDEDAWSVSFDDGDIWNQLSLVDTNIDYLSDVAVSPDCNKTMLVSVNEESGCECDSVWLHAENLPEAPEYSSKWLRTWCGQLEGDIGEGWERGLLRLNPEETTGDNVYLVDYGSGNVYWNNMETLACWDPIGCTELDFIVDLAAKDADTLYALDYYGDVAMFDEYEWYEAVDSEVDYGWTVAVRSDDILVGGCDGDVSYSDDGGETFTELEQVPVAADYTLLTVAFDSYFDVNDTIYAAAAGFVGSNPTTGGIYRWVIGESEEWEDLGAENYAYSGLVLNIPSGSKPKTSVDTGGVLYASYVNGDTTGVARCLTPAQDACCSATDWNYMTKGLTSELFKMTPQVLKVCGCLTPHIGSRLFAIDSSDYYDMMEGLTGTVWGFED